MRKNVKNWTSVIFKQPNLAFNVKSYRKAVKGFPTNKSDDFLMHNTFDKLSSAKINYFLVTAVGMVNHAGCLASSVKAGARSSLVVVLTYSKQQN